MTVLYTHTDTAPLIDLLERYLPYSLPVYNCLLLGKESFTYLASFEAGSTPPHLLAVVVDMGHQLRIFCSLDGAEESNLGQSDLLEERKAGGEFVVACIRDFVRRYSTGYKLRGIAKFGAINSYWLPYLRQESMTEFINWESCVLLGPSSQKSDGVDITPLLDLPDGLILRAGLPEDLNEILRTLNVDHSPEYLLSRLPHSTLLLSHSQIIGHCITHLDGSIGTLLIVEKYQGKGYGKLVVRDRMEREVRRGFSYVVRGNLSSAGLFKSIGFIEGFDVAWVGISTRR